MWLHIPNLPACPSAQGLEGLTSLSEKSLDAGLWVTSSVKPMQRAFSWRGWKTRRWIRLLFGTISRPSMASRGADEWISSLPVTHANLSALQAKGSQRKTPATSGLMLPESSRMWGQRLLFSKMSEDMSTGGFEESSKTFMVWGSMRNGVFIQRPKPELPTAAIDYSSWPTAKNWATPTACDAKASGATGYSTKSGRHSGITLTDAVMRWAVLCQGWETLLKKLPTNSLFGLPDPKMIGRIPQKNSDLRLNPLFVEWLMGFGPVGWTDFEPLVTRSAHSKPN